MRDRLFTQTKKSDSQLELEELKYRVLDHMAVSLATYDDLRMKFHIMCAKATQDRVLEIQGGVR